MDDKFEAIMSKVDVSLERIYHSLENMADCMMAFQERSREELERHRKALEEVRAFQSYLSGRWPRRDGDGFVISPPASDFASDPNANRPPGNLRPPD